MGFQVRGEQGRLRGLGEAPGLVGLGTLAGDALTVEGSFGKQRERVGNKPELMLRNRKRAALASHGVKW